MYEYEDQSNPLGVELLPNIELVLDDLPIKHPYVPRLCKEQGNILIWYGTSETEADVAEVCFRSKNEDQWITSRFSDRVEKVIALIWPYDDEIIIGAVKYPGYMQGRSRIMIKALLREVWADIVTMFGHKRIICPTGDYIDMVQITMNHSRIPRESYSSKLMRKYKFNRVGDFWVREPNK